MTIEDINKILLQREGTTIEFKLAHDNVPSSLYETIVSFANSDGGTILLGVDNDGKVLGLEYSQLEKYSTDITTAMNTQDCINPRMLLPLISFSHPKGNILILQIPLSSQIHDHGGKDHWLGLPEESVPHLEEGLKHVALDSSIAATGWEELILFLVPTWHQKIANLSELKWPDKQIIKKEEIKKVPSWAEKGTNLLHKKARYLLTILFLTSKEISIEKLMTWLNYKNKPAFRNNYMLPLQKTGLISMTKPEKPTDPEQRYKLTDKGRLFLAGRMM
jgi:predicted transcriptional regulator